MSFSAIPLDSDPVGKDEDNGEPVKETSRSSPIETTPGDNEPVSWEVVAETRGLLPAQIIAGRLQSEGLPARAWQESVGQGFGLTMGKMGTGYVSVPDTFVEQALEILDSDVSTDD